MIDKAIKPRSQSSDSSLFGIFFLSILFVLLSEIWPQHTLWRRNRHKDGLHVGSAPATPPGIQVRTGRFVRLRSWESRHTQPVKVRDGQHNYLDIHRHAHGTLTHLRQKTSGISSWLHSPVLEPPRTPGRFRALQSLVQFLSQPFNESVFYSGCSLHCVRCVCFVGQWVRLPDACGTQRRINWWTSAPAYATVVRQSEPGIASIANGCRFAHHGPARLC